MKKLYFQFFKCIGVLQYVPSTLKIINRIYIRTDHMVCLIFQPSTFLSSSFTLINVVDMKNLLILLFMNLEIIIQLITQIEVIFIIFPLSLNLSVRKFYLLSIEVRKYWMQRIKKRSKNEFKLIPGYGIHIYLSSFL